MQVINIDLTAIANSKKYRKASNGHNYINLVIGERKEPDRDGNTLTVTLSKTKEEREANVPTVYVGSGKIYGQPQPQPQAAPVQEQPKQTEDLPF